MQVIGGDITAVQCLMFTAILESCIQCGLIQTNNGYDELFKAGTFGAQIADHDHKVRYASANSPVLSEQIMCTAEAGAVKSCRQKPNCMTRWGRGSLLCGRFCSKSRYPRRPQTAFYCFKKQSKP